MPEEYILVGRCGTCNAPVWSTKPLIQGALPGEALESCRCSKIKADPKNAPLPQPPMHEDIVRCLAAGGHVISPNNWPDLPWSTDPVRNSMVYETTPCIRCGINFVLEYRHISAPPKGVTILKDPGKAPAPQFAPPVVLTPPVMVAAAPGNALPPLRATAPEEVKAPA